MAQNEAQTTREDAPDDFVEYMRQGAKERREELDDMKARIEALEKKIRRISPPWTRPT